MTPRDVCRADVAGLILCGGRNRRMGGKKKLFLSWEGQPFYQHLLHALSCLSVTRLSVEDEAPYRHLGLPLIVDAVPGIGPLGGLCSALRAAPEPALLVVPCDMPLVDASTVARLLAAYDAAPMTTVVRSDRGISPFPGIYPRSCLPAVEAQTAAGNYRMLALLEQLPAIQAVSCDARVLENINTPDQYRSCIAAEAYESTPDFR